MQKYRADKSEQMQDGSIAWFADWIGGPILSKIEKCRLANLEGDMRRTVYITGEADTYFSIPAVCSLGGCRVKGYVTCDTDSGSYIFRHVYY
jgi:hypothetical protein